MRLFSTFILLLGLISCRSLPHHEMCVLDPANEVAYCSRTDAPDVVTDKPLAEMESYIARSPEDERLILEWAKRRCRQD